MYIRMWKWKPKWLHNTLFCAFQQMCRSLTRTLPSFSKSTGTQTSYVSRKYSGERSKWLSPARTRRAMCMNKHACTVILHAMEQARTRGWQHMSTVSGEALRLMSLLAMCLTMTHYWSASTHRTDHSRSLMCTTTAMSMRQSHTC